MNPIAVLHMINGTDISIELLPDFAPNTVASFIFAAKHGIFNHHAIERIVPGNWIDISYTGFQKREGQYLIPYEFLLHPEIPPLDSDIGSVCMGGYGDLGESGCEFFFPLRPCPEHKGIYPVFGRVLSGIEEILRLEHIPTRPVDDFPIPGIEVNKPIVPEVIGHVSLNLNGKSYPNPVLTNMDTLPPPWEQYWKKNRET